MSRAEEPTRHSEHLRRMIVDLGKLSRPVIAVQLKRALAQALQLEALLTAAEGVLRSFETRPDAAGRDARDARRLMEALKKP